MGVQVGHPDAALEAVDQLRRHPLVAERLQLAGGVRRDLEQETGQDDDNEDPKSRFNMVQP